MPVVELERRLLELGFIEGAEVVVLHEGPVARDPLAVRVNGATIALRRREAMAILVTRIGHGRMNTATTITISERHFALVGTPNSGKTALFNALTGSRQKVANYPGVTVERKSGVFHTASGQTVRLIDLPGTYSLRGRSPDEEITRDVVLGRLAAEPAPDLIVCVTDATNLRVSLRLVLELRRVGRPLLLVLNMIDIARRRGMEIDLNRLSAELGVPVVTSSAVRRGGTDVVEPPRSDGGWRSDAFGREPMVTPDTFGAARRAARGRSGRSRHPW